MAPELFFVLYICVVIGVAIFILVMIYRLVRAHERMAGALEKLALGPSREGR